ncbi:RimK family alpha-L-glutamate ligase [Methylonatrum kenyense]|uniref:ATP-grasp domain-containing protein n=1 Tax=Methylonatrum kenyense TaxID=455253 RepID=UPI0020BF9A7D|nr:RimK family alpha-L-glutamate ligase [Methylonatrum kenyense]MCK8515429.1 RimK family alpha-L-glutamate ligase [Methylonatrum kenyense]
MSTTVAIVTDTPGWHGARLRDAFRRRGCDAPWLQLQDCVIDTRLPGGVRLPGFGGRLPDAVFVRGIPGGSLEQVVFHLNILHILQALGVPVYNDGRAIERSVDKALTSALLARDGINTPPTWVCANRDEAESILAREFAAGHRVVIKPLFGAQGEGVQRLERAGDLPPAAACQGVYYLQRYVDTGESRGRDWRVLVAGGHAVAAMQRIGLDWISNVARGGEVRSVPLAPELAEPAERAVAVLEMDYGGVDLIRDADGRIHVLEVNSVPAWRGLQTVVETDIAQLLADDLLRRRLGRPALEVVS